MIFFIRQPDRHGKNFAPKLVLPPGRTLSRRRIVSSTLIIICIYKNLIDK
jgi:hypothetical protein